MNESVQSSLPNQSLHLHVISMHTSPLAQPGQGDAGGMNVYIRRSLDALLERYPQLTVEIFSLQTSPDVPQDQHPDARVSVHYIQLEGARGVTKADLPAFVAPFADAVAATMNQTPDVIHSHYWLSGLAALTYGQDIPIVHTMHTTAAAKDARASEGEPHEPAVRWDGERKVVDGVSALVVNTEIEKEQLVRFYQAEPTQIFIIEPGVDTDIFCPQPGVTSLNAGSSTRAHLVFAGRPQHLKGPQILVEALALLPQDLSVTLEMIGKSGTDFERQLSQRAAELGLAEAISLSDPLPAPDLAQRFRRADVVACPSSSETFGLVALEAQACGTPVLASDADGLAAAVHDGVSGRLVSPRTPAAWAQAITELVRNPDVRAQLGAQAASRATSKTWGNTAHHLFDLYRATLKNPTTKE